MTTPTTTDSLTMYDDLPWVEAVRQAWWNSGPDPVWHARMQDEVRREMPVLARALDRSPHPGGEPALSAAQGPRGEGTGGPETDGEAPLGQDDERSMPEVDRAEAGRDEDERDEAGNLGS